MRIGLDISSVKVGQCTGIETYTRGFLGTLSGVNDSEHDYYAFTTANNLSLADPSFRRIRFVTFPGNNQRRWLRVLMQQTLIPYHARRLGLDVVNFQNGIAALTLPCASVLHIKTLHHYHAPKSLTLGQNLARRLLFGPSARRADLIIANTQHTKDDICHFYRVSPDKVAIVQEGVDTGVFLPCQDGEETHIESVLGRYGVRRPFLLFVSSLWPYKNPQTLIRAFACLVQEHGDLKHQVAIVGGDDAGYLAELKRLTQDLGVDHRVKFVGHVADRSVVRCFYAGADVFVYPSLYETFGLTVLEAMACGTPVIASNTTSLPEVVGDAGLMVDPEDVQALKQAVYSVISDGDLYRHLVSRGLDRASHFSWERTARETVKVYERAVALRDRRRRGG